MKFFCLAFVFATNRFYKMLPKQLCYGAAKSGPIFINFDEIHYYDLLDHKNIISHMQYQELKQKKKKSKVETDYAERFRYLLDEETMKFIGQLRDNDNDSSYTTQVSDVYAQSHQYYVTNPVYNSWKSNYKGDEPCLYWPTIRTGVTVLVVDIVYK